MAEKIVSNTSLVWDSQKNALATEPDDSVLVRVTMDCFLSPGPESLAALEACLISNTSTTGESGTLMRRCALVVQTANAVLEEEYRQLSELFTSQGQPVVCAAGCASCCHQLVLCHPYEAELIGAFLRANPDVRQAFSTAWVPWETTTATLRHSYLAWAELFYGQGKDNGTHKQDDYHVPCPFLDERHYCRIYPARPYACRTSIALDPACPNPPDGKRPGSRNIHYSLYTNHQNIRKDVTDILRRLLGTDPKPVALAERVAVLLGL